MNTGAHHQVVVVGGGVGGLSVACFLRARGFDVTVLERQSPAQVDASTQRGNGIHLYFHCARMLLGAGVPLAPYLTPLDIQMRRDDGRLRSDISHPVQVKVCPELGCTRASLYSLLRQHLYKVLVEQTPPETFHRGANCVDLTQDAESAQVMLADGTVVRAGLVIGADGIRSVVCDRVIGPRPITKHGVVIIQGTSTYDDLEPIETWILHRQGGTMGLVPVVLPSLAAGTFWWISVPSTELSDLSRSDLDCYRAVCTRYAWDPVRRVAEGIDPSSLERWYSQDRTPLRQWYDGRVAILGDACHAATPFSGYGAGMAIEDGYWLARYLGDPGVLRRPADLAAALAAYQAKRAGWTARIVHEARGLMHALHPSRRPVGAFLNGVWSSGLLGPVIARKFIGVFKQGLADTVYEPHEVEAGKLDF